MQHEDVLVLLENHTSIKRSKTFLSWLASLCSKAYLSSIGCLLYAVPRVIWVSSEEVETSKGWPERCSSVTDSVTLLNHYAHFQKCPWFIELSLYTLVILKCILSGFSL